MSTFLDQPNTSTPVSRQQTTTPRPSLPRSNSTPSWHKNSSMENLRPPRTLQPPVVTTINTGPSLKKRHSTYTLPSPLDRPRGSGPLSIAPIRPLRNPARVGVTATSSVAGKKSGPNSRPSTASSSREEITPWEFASGPVGDGPPPASPIPSGSASPLSAQARPSPTTGLVSEVTPWEMYPVRRSATSRSSLTSGFIEEVTPWELHPVPAIMPSRSTLATGPMEDVTPWELAAVPPPVDIPAPINTEKRSSVSGILALILF
ncbi:hypothetical protein H0H93_003463 [Arthromyces matolae]|nr:hypothetical protein H0H93_003463 [Arthromyces matolae]